MQDLTLKTNHELRKSIEEWLAAHFKLIPRDAVTIEEGVVARGSFKVVFRGQLRGHPETIAVLKMADGGSCEEEAATSGKWVVIVYWAVYSFSVLGTQLLCTVCVLTVHKTVHREHKTVHTTVHTIGTQGSTHDRYTGQYTRSVHRAVHTIGTPGSTRDRYTGQYTQ